MINETKEKIGLFGGTFDPIHFGHLRMATELMQAKNLQEIWFCPARMNPHKLGSIPTTGEHRLKMLEIALSDHPKFSVIDVELERVGPSYTIDTIKFLLEQEGKRPNPRQIHLIISDEAAASFPLWKDPKEIIELTPLIIGSRNSSSSTPPRPPGDVDPEILKAITDGWTPTEKLDISSTEIRKRLKEGVDCHDLVPKKVLDYISQNKLYCHTETS